MVDDANYIYIFPTYLNNCLNLYFSLKWVSSPDWTLIYEGVNISIPLKTDWLVRYDTGDEVQTIVVMILGFLTTFVWFNINRVKLTREHHDYVRNKNNRMDKDF